MLTNQISLAETATTEDLADWAERRDALRIRPLLECPRLRAAMGMTELPTHAVAAAATVTPASTSTRSNKRMPSTTSAPSINTRTKHTAKRKARAR